MSMFILPKMSERTRKALAWAEAVLWLAFLGWMVASSYMFYFQQEEMIVQLAGCMYSLVLGVAFVLRLVFSSNFFRVTRVERSPKHRNLSDFERKVLINHY